MRSYQVFAALPPGGANGLLRALAEQSPVTFTQAVAAACVAMKSRPSYLQRLPFEKRAEAVRRALSRVAGNDVADEVLATYFLECHRPLLVEWLDAVGLEHEDGVLTTDAPPPPSGDELEAALSRFRGKDDAGVRELLLHAFAAQSAVDWPQLEARLEPVGPV